VGVPLSFVNQRMIKMPGANRPGDALHRWGIGASVGGTIKFQQFSLEPFLDGGYQRLKLSGDGSNFNPYYPWTDYYGIPYDVKKTRNEWSIEGSLSIKF
jgi:hypothetical protein